MKRKIFSLLFILLTLAAFTSCVSESDTEDPMLEGDEEIHTDFEGVYLTLDSVGETSLSVTWHNDTDLEILFGEGYSIELLLSDGTWKSVLKDSIAFDAIAMLLPPDGDISKGYSSKPFDISASGTYRLRCEFWYDGNTYNTWVEFDVVE